MTFAKPNLHHTRSKHAMKIYESIQVDLLRSIDCDAFWRNKTLQNEHQYNWPATLLSIAILTVGKSCFIEGGTNVCLSDFVKVN